MIRIQKILILFVFVGQSLAQGVVIPGIGTPVYLISMILLSALTLIMWGTSSEGCIPRNNRFAINAILLVMYITFVCWFNENGGFDRVLLIATSFMFCLACYEVVQSTDDYRWLINIFICTAFGSSLVEIGQVCEVEFCFELWRMTHQGERIVASIAVDRYMGLSPTILHFAYFVSAAFIITLFYDFKYLNFLKKALLYIVFSIALVTNNTRSSIIVVVVAIILSMFWKEKNMKEMWLKKIIIIIMMIIGVYGLFCMEDIYLNSRFGNNEGVDTRISMFLTAFFHMLRHPLGTGVYNAESNALILYGNVKADQIVGVGAHNLLANCAANYGVIGLLLLMNLYGWIMKTFVSKRKKDSLMKGVFLTIVALAINAFVHNLYILSGELMSFMMIAILLKKWNDKDT